MTEAESKMPSDAPWWARWLAEEWKEAWKWLSVQIPIAAMVAIELYQAFPDYVGTIVPKQWMPHIAAAAFLLNAIITLRRKPAGAADEAPPPAGATQQGVKP